MNKQYFHSLSIPDKITYLAGFILDWLKVNMKRYVKLRKDEELHYCAGKAQFQIARHGSSVFINRKKLKIVLRKDTSDIHVFKQVFLIEEYKPVIDCILLNRIRIDNVIDAGSNIGLTTLKLYEHFPQAKFYCIEPDPGNFKQLQLNVTGLSNVTLFQNALWHKKENLALSLKFRDGGEWSRSVEIGVSDLSVVQSLTIQDLVFNYGIRRIDLLKIDIEGSEREIFSNESDLTFLNITKIICIEIHDEYDCRDQICNTLFEHGFCLFNAGELTIGINDRL